MLNRDHVQVSASSEITTMTLLFVLLGLAACVAILTVMICWDFDKARSSYVNFQHKIDHEAWLDQNQGPKS